MGFPHDRGALNPHQAGRSQSPELTVRLTGSGGEGRWRLIATVDALRAHLRSWSRGYGLRGCPGYQRAGRRRGWIRGWGGVAGDEWRLPTRSDRRLSPTLKIVVYLSRINNEKLLYCRKKPIYRCATDLSWNFLFTSGHVLHNNPPTSTPESHQHGGSPSLRTLSAIPPPGSHKT